MSVQSIGQDTTNSWLAQLLASYSSQSSSAATSLESLLGTASISGDDAANSSTTSSTTSSVGSFNDILQALLSGNGSVGYDMETGTLTDLSAAAEDGAMPPPPMDGADGLTREMTETQGEDGSVSRTITMTDANGNLVSTEQSTINEDGSFSSVLTMVDPDGNTTTRTTTGTYAEDGSFTVESSLTAADGTVLETGTETTAADGSFTRSLTRIGPDGETITESESYDADGNLLATSTASTTTTASSGANGASGAAGGSDASSESSDSEETTTTVTTAFTTEGMEQTTTVTDADGKIVSQTVKEIPFSSTAEGESYGASLGSQEGLSGLIDQYARNRYGAGRYAAMAADGSSEASQGGSVSMEA